MTKPHKDEVRLLATAQAVASRLKMQSRGTKLRIRIPKRAIETTTDGWSATIGDLGGNQPQLEMWFDPFSGHTKRRFWAGFRSESEQPISTIINNVTKKLWPVRVVTPDDLADANYVLRRPLERSDFDSPVLEKHGGGATYFGIYDPSKVNSPRAIDNFCDRAVGFFEDVARALPRATDEDSQNDAVYPRCENRKWVKRHLGRERSSYKQTPAVFVSGRFPVNSSTSTLLQIYPRALIRRQTVSEDRFGESRSSRRL